jgi:endonuclease IV
MNGKHEKLNKTKKTSGIPFHFGKLQETADVIKRQKSINVPINFILIKVSFSSIYG